MKAVIVHPSVAIRVICPDCGAKGRLNKQEPPHEDFAAACPRCKERFLIKINRRAYYRKNTALPVHYSLHYIHWPEDKRARQGTIADMSLQGMRVEGNKFDLSRDYHKEGALLSFLFSLPPRNELLRIEGEVTRLIKEGTRSSFMLGVKFSNLDHYANKQIGFFLMP